MCVCVSVCVCVCATEMDTETVLGCDYEKQRKGEICVSVQVCV